MMKSGLLTRGLYYILLYIIYIIYKMIKVNQLTLTASGVGQSQVGFLQEGGESILAALPPSEK